MTSGPQEPALHLVADLRVNVDGVQAQVSGDGPELVIETAHPLQFVQATARAALPGAASPRQVAAAAGELLASRGVSVTLTGPRGRLATIGATADSSVGAVVVGTRRVSFALPSWARPVLTVSVAAVVGVLIRRARRWADGH